MSATSTCSELAAEEAVPALRRRSLVEGRAVPVYALLAVAALAVAAAIASSAFSYDGRVLNGAFLMLAVLAGCGMGARWASFSRLGGATESMALITAIAFVAPIGATLLAATARPLADAALLEMDRLLFFGFDRRTAIPPAELWHPQLLEATRFVYHSLSVQPLILIGALFLLRQEQRAWTFLTAWSIALLVSVALFPLVPAMGTPPYSLEFAGTFEGARDGSLRIIDIRSLTGIITFPSFHAAAAVLLGWGFLRLRGAAVLFVPLNILMFVSALFAGGHYVIDLVAGALVAVAAILLAKRVQRAAGSSAGTPSQPA